MKRAKYTNCTVTRCRLVLHEMLSLTSGAITPAGETWETRACGNHLFTDAEKAIGTCRSCASGWTHPHNYRAVQ